MGKKDDTHSAKPEKFTGLFFKRWQNQMKFWLTTLGLLSAIDGSNTQEATPSFAAPTDSGSPKSSSSKTKTPQEIEFHCFHRILSALSDQIYDIFFEYKSAKELWDALESEYGLDDSGIDRFNSLSFNKYIMVDDKPMND